MSRAEGVGLDNLSGVVLSLEKTDSPLSSHGLATTLLLRARSCEISPTYLGMSSGIANVQVLLKQPIVEISWAQLPCHVQKTSHNQTSWSSDSYHLSA